ncbi:MAG: zinc-binding alcohol dehydrogenase family protein [Acidobacteriaceae bacterium]
MKALKMREPGFAQIEEVPEPQVKAGEALLRVRRVGLCGSDLNSFRGRNPMVSFPRIPGHEVAATIVAINGDHASLTPGMDVTLSPYTSCGMCPACQRDRPNACEQNQTLGVQRDGALAEYISVPLENIYPAPLNLRELCLVEPLTVGFHAAARARITEADTVAIFGCGGVGLGAIAASVFRGANTIAVDIDDKKLAVAHALGTRHEVNSLRQPLAVALDDLTQGKGPDVVIEAIGTTKTFQDAVALVAFTGRVVYIGYALEPVAYETKLFVQKELDILGSRNALPEDFRSVIQMLKEQRFPVDKAISTVCPLVEAPAIFSAWSANPAAFTKIMIDLD